MVDTVPRAGGSAELVAVEEREDVLDDVAEGEAELVEDIEPVAVEVLV